MLLLTKINDKFGGADDSLILFHQSPGEFYYFLRRQNTRSFDCLVDEESSGSRRTGSRRTGYRGAKLLRKMLRKMFCVLGRKESSPLPNDFLWYSVLIFGSLYGNPQGMRYPV